LDYTLNLCTFISISFLYFLLIVVNFRLVKHVQAATHAQDRSAAAEAVIDDYL